MREVNQDALPGEIGKCLDELNLALSRYMVALGGSFLPTYYDGGVRATAYLFLAMIFKLSTQAE